MRVGQKEILLLAASTFFTLVTFEIGARIWLNHSASPSEYQKYALYTEIDPKNWMFSPHPYLNYYLTPGYKSGLTQHNSLGYRDKEFPTKKPLGEYRIAALGGSTIYTSAVPDNDKTFPSQLENILKGKYGYKNVKVINAGVPGYSTWETLINFEFRVLDLEPDMVVIYPCVNDVTQRLVLASSYRGDNTGSRKQWSLPPVNFYENICLLRIFSRKLGIADQVSVGQSLVGADTNLLLKSHSNHENIPYEELKNNPPIFFERNLQNVIAVAKENNIKIMFATFAHSPNFSEKRSRYYSVPIYQLEYKRQNLLVQNIALKHNVPVFDFASAMSQDSQYWADPVHVNEKGALLKARLFAEFINTEKLVH